MMIIHRNIYTERQYEMQLKAFPDGQFIAVRENRIIGYATSIIVNIDDEFWYDVDEISGAGTFSTHNPDGDTRSILPSSCSAT